MDSTNLSGKYLGKNCNCTERVETFPCYLLFPKPCGVTALGVALTALLP
jgi:hypothetical protein